MRRYILIHIPVTACAGMTVYATREQPAKYLLSPTSERGLLPSLEHVRAETCYGEGSVARDLRLRTNVIRTQHGAAAAHTGGGGLLRRVGNKSGVWSCLANLLGDLGLELREVLAEEVGEFPGLLVVGVAVVPGPAWVQDAAIDSRHRDGHVEAEEGVLSGLGVVQLAPDHGADHLAGGGDVYTATYAVWAAGPAGVDQVAAGAVRPQPLGEHLGVGGSWQRKERGAEARGERRLDLGLHLGLGTGELGGVAGEEVVGCLRRREGAYGGQHSECVSGQKEDGRRMNAPAFGDRARYVLQRVGDAGVLRQHAVGVVHLACAPVHHHVLEHGAEADGVPYLGFLLGGEVYRLRVATALEVEDPRVGPAVLVVTDQVPPGVGREGRLARPREPEEERNVSFLSHVGRAVHREDTMFGRQHEVEHGEDALLYLPRVGRTANEYYLALEVYPDEGL